MKKKLLSTKEYYQIVEFLERELDEIANGSDNLLIPAIGTPQHFPQATSQARIASQQAGLLQERIREMIAVFNTYASLAKVNKEYEVHSLDEESDKKVELYIKYFKDNKNKYPDLLEEWKEEEELEKQEQNNGEKSKGKGNKKQ